MTMFQRVYRFFASNIRNRLLLVMLLVSLPALLGIATYSVFFSRALISDATLRSQEDRVTTLALDLTRFFAGVREDVLFLSQSAAIVDLLTLDANELGYEAARQALEREFLAFSQAKDIYYQVRFIDATGMEIVRVDSDGTQSFVVPQAQLQDKSGRYYFDDAIVLSEGEVLVSPLDLNIERGEIERPFKPVIRYATPVWAEGRAVGIVIVNVFAERILDFLGEQAESNELIALVDQQGYYLYHSEDETKRWGRDLQTDITLEMDYPAVMAHLWTLDDQDPVLGSFQSGDEFVFYERLSPPGTTDLRWALLSVRSRRGVIAPLLRFEWTMLWGLLVFVAAVVALGYWSSAGMVRPVRQLEVQALRMGEGDLETPIAVAQSSDSNAVVDEIGRLARALDQARLALLQAYEDLESQVHRAEARAVQLQTAAEVARSSVAIREPQELLSDVVNLISARFGFYHTGIFLLDDTHMWAELQFASSEGGQRMLAHGHRLRVGQQGIVGYVAATGTPRIALDVGEDATHFVNPDLPDTRSEMALPLKVQDQVIGVLDVQSREASAFTDEDIVVLQTLADQIAMALQNARLFEESEARYEAMRRAQGDYGREAWRQLAAALMSGGYRYKGAELLPAEDFWQPEMTTAVQQETFVYDEVNPETVALPLRVREQVIGVVNARKPDGNAWTSEEVALLEILQGRLEVALESARFYQETQRSAAREQLLRVITERVRGAVDVDSVMRTAAQEIGQALGREVFVYIADSPDVADTSSKTGES